MSKCFGNCQKPSERFGLLGERECSFEDGHYLVQLVRLPLIRKNKKVYFRQGLRRGRKPLHAESGGGGGRGDSGQSFPSRIMLGWSEKWRVFVCVFVTLKSLDLDF